MQENSLVKQKRVVVIGGGFAGLEVVRALKNAPLKILLIDKTNHYCFQPLLYQVATAALNPAEIAQPLRGQLREQRNCEIRLDKVTDIKVQEKKVFIGDEAVSYDYLVLAAGASNFYFGHDEEWSKNALGLKSLAEALAMRDQILRAFEQAEWAKNEEERAFYLTFVVVGGGPTGIELAGALSEIAKNTLAKNFRHFDTSAAKIIVVEGFERILPQFPADLSAKVMAKLKHMNVEVLCNKKVESIDKDGVVIDGKAIKAATVLWAAGVRASFLTEKIGAPLDKQARVLVEKDLSIARAPEVMVIGDIAHIIDEKTGKPVPGVAQSAMQMGRHVAANIIGDIQNKKRENFCYRDLGSLAQVGRGVAVAHIGRIKSVGFFAWCLWLFVHLRSIVGFNLKFIILFKWAWSFFTHERDSRLLADRTLISVKAPSARSS